MASFELETEDRLMPMDVVGVNVDSVKKEIVQHSPTDEHVGEVKIHPGTLPLVEIEPLADSNN